MSIFKSLKTCDKENKKEISPVDCKKLDPSQSLTYSGGSINPKNYYTRKEIDAKGFLTKETDPTVPDHVKGIT